MEMTDGWTGRAACALQSALRMSNHGFAAHLRVGVRTVGDWHERPDIRPQPKIQQNLDRALAHAPASARERFAALIRTQSMGVDASQHDDDATAEAERRLITDEHISAALGRLDELADWEAGHARRRVASLLGDLDKRDLVDRASRRRRVGRRRVADALGDYYQRSPAVGHGR